MACSFAAAEGCWSLQVGRAVRGWVAAVDNQSQAAVAAAAAHTGRMVVASAVEVLVQVHTEPKLGHTGSVERGLRSCWVGIQAVLEVAAIGMVGMRSLAVLKELPRAEQRSDACRQESRSAQCLALAVHSSVDGRPTESGPAAGMRLQVAQASAFVAEDAVARVVP